MELHIHRETDGIVRLALEGRLDTDGVDRVETRVNAALARAEHGVLDLSGVTFLSSLGVRLLLSAAKTLQRRGARLIVVAPQPLVEEALRFSALDQILPVARDVDGALALLQG